MLFIASGIKNSCFALFTLFFTTGITWAFSYTIDTNPPGAIIINVVTKQKIG
jgi:hypothetical protein